MYIRDRVIIQHVKYKFRRMCGPHIEISFDVFRPVSPFAYRINLYQRCALVNGICRDRIVFRTLHILYDR